MGTGTTLTGKAAISGILLAASLIAADDQHMPPDIEAVAKYGCQLEQATGPDDPTLHWLVKIWVDYQEEHIPHTWNQLYSVRKEEEQAKAFIDCGKWMAEVKKAIKLVVQSTNKHQKH